MHVRLITRYEEFAALEPAWRRLHDHACDRSVFLSHQWLDAAWQWCGRQTALHIVCCERDGDLIAALPLLRRDDGWGRPRALEFVAVPDTQHCDVLVRADDAASAVAAIATALRRPSFAWDVMRLRHLASDGTVMRALGPALGQAGLTVQTREVGRNPFVGLEGDWESFYRARSRRLKKAVNLADNRIGRAGEVTMEWLAPGDGDGARVAQLVADIVGVSARSWKRETGNSLDQEGPGAFLRRLCEPAHQRGWLSIFRLAIDARPVAMELQLVDGRDIRALRADFDSAFDEHSPGSYLSRHLLQQLFGRGLGRYYMGAGDNAYKYRWADGLEPVHAMTVYGRSVYGRALAAWELLAKPAAKRVRSWIGRGESTPAAQPEIDK